MQGKRHLHDDGTHGKGNEDEVDDHDDTSLNKLTCMDD